MGGLAPFSHLLEALIDKTQAGLVGEKSAGKQ